MREDRNLSLSMCIKAEGRLRDGAAMFGLLSYCRPANGLCDTVTHTHTRNNALHFGVVVISLYYSGGCHYTSDSLLLSLFILLS